MEYGKFINDGREYVVETPHTPVPWKNYLFSDNYFLEVDQTLQGDGYLVDNYERLKCSEGYRYFYIKDEENGIIWNPNYVPLHVSMDDFACTHGLYSSTIRSRKDKVECEIEICAPAGIKGELLRVKLKNLDSKEKALSVFFVAGLYDHGVMGGECRYDVKDKYIYKYSFPYHTFFEDKEKVEGKNDYYYLISSVDFESYELSRRRFFNGYEAEVPPTVATGNLSKLAAEVEDYCGAIKINCKLLVNETFEFFIEIGGADNRKQIADRKKAFTYEGCKKLLQDTENEWKSKLNSFYLKSPDSNLDTFANYLLKKQIMYLANHNRGTTYCPVRNQLQDAMGLSMIDSDGAIKLMLDILKLQRSDGFIQQWHDTTGAAPRGLSLLHHSDGPVWLVICSTAIIRQGDIDKLLNTMVPYADSGKDSILNHLKKAIIYLMSQRGGHGLCLMKDGDWNDPINAPGRGGKGESIWLSMALVYAINCLLPFLDDEDKDIKIFTLWKEELAQNINDHGWDGNQYAVAINDDGEIIGDSSDRLFLNTQAWAVLSEIADNNKISTIISNVKKLYTPFGPLIMYPPFFEWDERWGRLSVKKAGTTENGSVYCHATMFWAYTLNMLGDNNEFVNTILKTLPTNKDNPPYINLQIPIFLPNYYYGLKDSKNYGRSSMHIGTGTVAWMLMLIIEHLAGLRPNKDGLVLKPNLPDDWEELYCERTYKKARYKITIKKGLEDVLYVEGEKYSTCILPYKENTCFEIKYIYTTES